MRQCLLLVCTVLIASNLFSQVSGSVTDANGEPLPYANIWVENTSNGTSSNGEGNYSLKLKPGEYVLLFKFIGYETVKETVRVGNKPIRLDVVLQEQSLELSTISVNASAEDPAYEIIRNAIAKRKYYRDIVELYSADVYTKGLFRFDTTPEKILGQEIGDMEGQLDSNRKGILYLSEAESEFYYKAPNQFKEIMISSRVSGNDNGLSFNRAVYTSASFYENQLDLNRKVLSPIADAAMVYYRYKLKGTFFDSYKNLVYKIRVIPKNPEAAVFSGYIYITDKLWNIQGVDLKVTGKALNQPVLDTLGFRQTHVPVQAPDVWMPLSQSMFFNFSVFGFKGSGFMVTAFSDYDLSPDFDDDFFKKAILIVRDSANKKDAAYWEDARKIPLTEAEVKDYDKKDSLQVIWNSPAYKDSMDRMNNKFGITDALLGYTHTNSRNHSRWSIEPLDGIDFNAVQGWVPTLTASYRKDNQEEATKYTLIRGKLNYGFADEQFRASGQITRRFNSTNYAQLSVFGGRDAVQFNAAEPISPFLNALYSQIDKRNYLKLYDKRYLGFSYRQYLNKNLYGVIGLQYADRRGLINRTQYSFNREKRENLLYFYNVPTADERPTESATMPFFDQNQSLQFDLVFRIRFMARYLQYPERRFYTGSPLPDLILRYRKGIAAFDSDVQYDRLSLSVAENYSVGLAGTISFFAEGGGFLNDNPRLAFMDRYHFLGNQTLVGDKDRYVRSFLAMPYYDYSSQDYFLQAHVQHNFEGFLLDRVPLLRKLDWSVVAGAAYANTEQGNYAEINFGFDNIGWGIVRLFRFDLVAAFPDGEFSRLYPVFGISL